MSLNWLYATRFRNLIDTRLDLNPGVNLLYGENGSGKTSLLEAAYFLSSARSFRTTRQDPVIQHGADDCLVRGELTRRGSQAWQVGISRHRDGEREIRLNGQMCRKSSELARLLPTLLLGPESVDLLLGPPEGRRRFLNWGLFHVKHEFPGQWEEANRCLRQRNQVLREGGGLQELGAWSVQLAEHAEKLDRARQAYVSAYRPVFQAAVDSLASIPSVDLEYYRGWGGDTSLAEQYEKDSRNDQKRGYTQKGFQRADVRITVGGQSAEKVCSRGELKVLVWSMVLAQGALTDNQDTLYLIDDLASELDAEHRLRVGRFLADTGNQVLLTGVERGRLEASCDGRHKGMFHVKQGQVEVQES